MADDINPLEELKSKVTELPEEKETQSGTDIELYIDDSLSLRPIGKDILKAFEKLEEQVTIGSRIRGTRTGLKNWDMITGGFNPGQLHLIASRPGVGKTSLAFEVAFHATIHDNCPTALFTPGMNREEVVHRLVCSQADISTLSLAAGELSENEWMLFAKIAEVAYSSPLFVDDSVSLDTEDILTRCAALVELKLVVIDGLDLLKVQPAGASREQEIGDTARSLKQVSRELNVPLIVTCGVSRSAEQRSSRRPYLTDLPGGGRLEEAADGVFFLYRDFLDASSYTSEDAGNTIALVEPTELIIAKNPDGPLGMTRVGFVSAFRKFIDWDETSDAPTGF